jgi:hypothetical protein
MAKRRTPARTADPREVFLNVPFDKAYERQFVALVAAIVAIGRTPRCVLELPELGRGRLSRLLQHLAQCGVSIHDLSRVGIPVRFNMPFELGLACALSELEGQHQYVLLERQPYRLDRTLSDLKGRDPYIHKGGIRLTIVSVLDVLQSPTQDTDPGEVFRLYSNLWRTANGLKRRYRADSVFTRPLFQRVVAAASKLAADAGLLRAK